MIQAQVEIADPRQAEHEVRGLCRVRPTGPVAAAAVPRDPGVCYLGSKARTLRRIRPQHRIRVSQHFSVAREPVA